MRHCAECAKKISTSARRCPRCGWVTPWGRIDGLTHMQMLVPIVLVYLFYFAG